MTPRNHFARLTHDQQAQAIRGLAADGFGDHEIATRTGLHVEQIRRLLAVDHGEAAEAHARAWSGEQ
jgi:hypothetical protein